MKDNITITLIPVSKELPPPGEKVLLFAKDKERAFEGSHNPHVPQWYLPGMFFYWGEQYDLVTHWSYLPANPNKEITVEKKEST